MRRSALARWTALGIGLLACPLLSGCLVPVGAAWPSVRVTPLLQVDSGPDKVRAFRVDKTTSHGCMDFSLDNEYVLKEIPVSSAGWVSPQGKVACDYCWYWNCIALTYFNGKHHSVTVRLYEPDRQTLEIDSWDLPHGVQWKIARALDEREKAVDELVSTRGANSWQEMHEQHDALNPAGAESLFRFLAPGSNSPEHRQALLFAASEYERLAKTDPQDDPCSRVSIGGVVLPYQPPDEKTLQILRERMMQKAARLRDLAAK
jgi:hypothetical protein